MSRAIGVSPHIIVKAVQLLVDQGLVVSVRGRQGGLRLNKEPSEINVGAVNPIDRARLGSGRVFRYRHQHLSDRAWRAGLKGVPMRAQQAFLDVLSEHTLADFLPAARR